MQAGAVRRRLIKKYMPEEDLGLWVYLSHHHKNSNDIKSKFLVPFGVGVLNILILDFGIV